VIAGRGCVLGNACEFKNCLLLDGVQVPHFSYVGDSILGVKAHLGAGVICSNLRLDQKTVSVRLADGSTIDTGLRKVGAFVGDGAEAGCNSVLNPGTILGRKSLVMPCLPVSGHVPEGQIARVKNRIDLLRRRD
jgi:bifunctional N-acetylglucosamine-1-phosphate-uridyltransferase/glucosamine-1-phosphate-acetyltransferase GlmU-like protein